MTAAATVQRPDPRAERAALMRNVNVRWLMVGSFMTLLGDQFTLIALPWAVLQITTDPLVLGAVLAVIGIPRALFILIGGAFVDRHSPKRVLMLTKYVNFVLLALLAAAVATGQLTLWLLYPLALGIGLAAAFSIPAGSSMLPQVVAPHQLPAANGLLMGLRQLSMFLGPLLAALMIGLAGSTQGLAIAFGLDALSFIASAWTLAKVSTRPMPQPPRQAVLAAVAEGLRSFWADRDLRAFLLYGAAVSLLIVGPMQITLPVLASSTPGLGAAAFGTMIGAHGAGTLLGLTIASLRPHWRLGTLGLTILGFDTMVGLLFMPMGQITATWQGAALLLAIGTLGGFMQVLVFTWIQRRVAPVMMGRMMSLFMFIFVGLAPLSAAATGGLLRVVPLQAMFTAAGGLLVVIVAAALVGSRLRQLNDAAPARA
jgi:MFS family permease